jgi:hypothetical protein
MRTKTLFHHQDTKGTKYDEKHFLIKCVTKIFVLPFLVNLVPLVVKEVFL